jgi:Terminase small subunit
MMIENTGMTDGRSVGAIVAAGDLTPKQADFVAAYLEHGNATRAYRECFDAGDMTPPVVRLKAYQLKNHPKVLERTRELQAAAAETAVISVRARMVHLQQIVEASPDEVCRVVDCICPLCWTDHALAVATQAYLDALGTVSPLPAPDTSAPRPDCVGGPHQRVEITPTEHLSPSGRALFKGARQKANGEIEVFLHDQLAASDQLNRMQAAYVSRSENLTAHVHVDASKPNPWSGASLTPEQVLQRVLKSRQPITIEATNE